MSTTPSSRQLVNSVIRYVECPACYFAGKADVLIDPEILVAVWDCPNGHTTQLEWTEVFR